ncbi:MAG: hypothetical protein ACYC2H_02345 [Thermoplasmatota archaeon]
MLRPILAMALLVVSLSGCSSGPELSTPSMTPSVTDSTTTSSLPPKPVIRTDTLHLLNSPHMAGTLPPNGELVRTAIQSQSRLAAAGDQATWSLPAPGLTDLQNKFVIYVDIEGVVTTWTATPVCFWAIDMDIVHADGTAETLDDYCFPEQAVAPTGTRRLEFDIPQVLASPPLAGDRLVVTVEAFATYAPGATVDLLSGVADTDSTWTIEGLQIPIDTETYL